MNFFEVPPCEGGIKGGQKICIKKINFFEKNQKILSLFPSNDAYRHGCFLKQANL